MSISRIDIKNNHVVKGICFEGLRKLGDPEKFVLNIIMLAQMNF